MSRIRQIPVVVVHDSPLQNRPGDPAPSIALALLNEIEEKLHVFVRDGENSTIDLRWLIGMPREFERLRKSLGIGEVAATVRSAGCTEVQETAVPCVWWVTHRNDDGGRLGEFVEITEIPDILRSDRLAIPRGLAELRARCGGNDMSTASVS